MSNSITKLPINKFYNPTPIEINTFNSLIPENETESPIDNIFISLISSCIIILVLYLIVSYNNHTINSKTIILCYIVIFTINYISNLLSGHIKRLVSSFL